MDQATEQWLNEIREREKQATPLPWVCSDRGDGSGSVYEGTDDDYLDVALLDDGRCPFIRGEVRLEDGIFAAHARSDVPFLLELVAQQQAELTYARKLADERGAALEKAALTLRGIAYLNPEFGLRDPRHSGLVKLLEDAREQSDSLLAAKKTERGRKVPE